MKINEIYPEINQKINSLNEYLNNINLNPIELDELSSKIPDFNICFVGEFNSGKSSLINKLIDRPEMLPVGCMPETAVVSELKYGEYEVVCRVSVPDLPQRKKI